MPSKTRDGVSLRVAVDAFMSSTRCANPNTRRAYGTVLDTLLTDLDPDRALTGISGDELAEVVEGTWGGAAPATWNRNRAALSSFLAWCAKNRYPAPVLPPGLGAPRRDPGAAPGGHRAPALPPRAGPAGENLVADAV